MDRIFKLNVSKKKKTLLACKLYFFAFLMFSKKKLTEKPIPCSLDRQPSANALWAAGVAANTHFHYDQVLRHLYSLFRAPQDGQFHSTSSLRVREIIDVNGWLNSYPVKS